MYFANYYRIDFDGSGLTRLTEADANHAVVFASDLTYYVDTYSRIDMPPVVELRRTDNNALVSTLERGEITELLKRAGRLPRCSRVIAEPLAVTNTFRRAPGSFFARTLHGGVARWGCSQA